MDGALGSNRSHPKIRLPSRHFTRKRETHAVGKLMQALSDPGSLSLVRYFLPLQPFADRYPDAA
jgi:hypothetical protein